MADTIEEQPILYSEAPEGVVASAEAAAVEVKETLSAYVSPLTGAVRRSSLYTHLKAIAPYIVECIGALFLVMTVVFVVAEYAAAIAPGASVPIVVGTTLMVIVFFGGHISGGHYNPAVTIAVLVRGKISMKTATGYIIAQIVGGLAGSAIANSMRKPGMGAPYCAPGAGYSHGHVFVVELLYTFLLTYTVLQVATTTTNPAKGGNHFFGLAIGFSVLVGVAAVGEISGGAFNPAVVTGMNVVALKNLKGIWIYYLAEFAAGIAAGLLFYVTNALEFTE